MSNMVVRTNVLALNSHRNLGNVGNMQARASARLSSGFRINSAADDAAGLGISENMRAQIRGLDQASRNAQDGISLIQTAEGGLNTINEMITRIRELTVQAANDINTSEGAVGVGTNESNRARIQGEINHLIDEIQRTATTLQFNGMTLLDGSLGSVGFNFSATDAVFTAAGGGTDLTAYLGGANGAAFLSWLNNTAPIGTNPSLSTVQQWLATEELAAADGLLAEHRGILTAFGGADAFADWIMANRAALTAFDASALDLADATTLLSGLIPGGVSLSSAQMEALIVFADDFDEAGGTLWTNPDLSDPTTTRFELMTAINELFAFTGQVTRQAGALDGLGLVGGAGEPFADDAAFRTWFLRNFGEGTEFEKTADGSGLWLQIGANSEQGIVVNMPDIVNQVAEELRTVFGSPDFEGVTNENSNVGSVAEGSGTTITALLDDIDAVLAVATAARGAMGAIQNRLEFTIQNLDVSSENLSAANSRIRDADMAAEMMRLTQANVLQQAATAMLAQGNQAPQNILQLLG